MLPPFEPRHGEYIVRPEDIEEIPFAPLDRGKVKAFLDRLYELGCLELEESSRAFVASLGETAGIGLSPLEETILAAIGQSRRFAPDRSGASFPRK